MRYHFSWKSDKHAGLPRMQRWEESERESLKEELRTVTETIDKMITTGAAAVVCAPKCAS